MTEDILTRLRDACVNIGAPFAICSDFATLCTACEAARVIVAERALADELAAALWRVRPQIGGAGVLAKMTALAEHEKARHGG